VSQNNKFKLTAGQQLVFIIVSLYYILPCEFYLKITVIHQYECVLYFHLLSHVASVAVCTAKCFRDFSMVRGASGTRMVIGFLSLSGRIGV